MHWKTKQAAVEKYQPIYKERGEEATLLAMASDEKLSVEDRGEIMEALAAGVSGTGDSDGTPTSDSTGAEFIPPAPAPVPSAGISLEELERIKQQAREEAMKELQASQSVATATPASLAPTAPAKPNDAIAEQLAAIDYSELHGAAFKSYTALVNSLPLDGMYDFELKRARPIRRPRYEGIEGSPVDMVGLEIINPRAEHSTRIPVRAALDYNRQIENAHSIAGHGKYYFLKK